MSESQIADRIEKFLSRADELWPDRISTDTEDSSLMLADLHAVVAILRGPEREYIEFIKAADKAISGWSTAHKNQMETIRRLMHKFDAIRRMCYGWEVVPTAEVMKELDK